MILSLWKVINSVQESTEVAMDLCKLQSTDDSFHTQRGESALCRQQQLLKPHIVLAEEDPLDGIPKDDFEVTRRDWKVIAAAYETWCAAVYMDTGSKIPTAQQRVILTTIHLRRKYEYFVEQGMLPTEDIQDISATPLYRLIHGLPGSGKSEVLLWLRSYFEIVWEWTHGDQFVFLASMNSMADNIGGITLHSYFGIAFKDHRGLSLNSSGVDRNWNSSLTKMSLLDFLFIDEVENAAADLLGTAEEQARICTRRADAYRFPGVEEGTPHGRLPRAWGGVNVIFIGDWWQLHPQGVALMSNPFSKTVLECSAAKTLMASVWCTGRSSEDEDTAVDFMLQEWKPSMRVLELSVNIRSGQDLWWNEVLEECRIGALSENNFDWIHGYEAVAYISNAPLRFWYETRGKPAPCNSEDCKDQCGFCKREVARRNRLVPKDVMPEAFKEAILITPHNQAVFHYALHCAREFAKREDRQLMWCPPQDTAPAWFVAGYTHEEMHKKQQNWLFYNARNTQGILSLCPLAYGMPFRMTRGNGKDMKEHGIHNGARGKLVDWTLHPDDVLRLQNCTDGEVTLTQLPLVLVLCMETRMLKKHPDYPEQHFPVTPVWTNWTLGAGGSDQVDIRRRGFGMVPNFSTTIDGAVGRTMDKAVAALGKWTEVASPTRAMKGYIAVSRVRCADDIRIAEPFSPCLFTQGEQPWPTFLLAVQKGSISAGEGFQERCAQVQTESCKMKRLKTARFHCSTCNSKQKLSHFIMTNEEAAGWYKDIEEFVLRPGGRRRSCRNRGRTAPCAESAPCAEVKELLKCSKCFKEKPHKDYSFSMWKNRVQKWRDALCVPCEAAHTLRGTSAVALCRVCGISKGADSFWWETWRQHGGLHRGADGYLQGGSMQCKDCDHPPCTAPRCKECRMCREHHRADKMCKAEIQALHSRRPRPTTLTEVKNFVCNVCRPNLCMQWPACSKVRTGKRAVKAKTWTGDKYLCGDCENVQFSREKHKRHFG